MQLCDSNISDYFVRSLALMFLLYWEERTGLGVEIKKTQMIELWKGSECVPEILSFHPVSQD